MEKENKIWKDIIGYENLYQVSNYGNVKSLKFGKEKILKQSIRNNYFYVVLYKEGKQKNYLVHRLVASAFIPNPQNLPCVNHKDENKQNNYIENLEFCTQKYNINYGTRNQRCSKANSISHKGKILSQEHKDKIGKAKKDKPNLVLSKPILQFNREGTKILGKWDSARQVEKELNILATSICKCCNGKLKTAGKYKWKYLQDYKNEK